MLLIFERKRVAIYIVTSCSGKTMRGESGKLIDGCRSLLARRRLRRSWRFFVAREPERCGKIRQSWDAQLGRAARVYLVRCGGVLRFILRCLSNRMFGIQDRGSSSGVVLGSVRERLGDDLRLSQQTLYRSLRRIRVFWAPGRGRDLILGLNLADFRRESSISGATSAFASIEVISSE